MTDQNKHMEEVIGEELMRSFLKELDELMANHKRTHAEHKAASGGITFYKHTWKEPSTLASTARDKRRRKKA